MKIDCPYCDGTGEIMDRKRIHSRSMEPPMRSCSLCGGVGRVDDSASDLVEMYPTIRDYEEAEADSAAEARWEQRNDR